MARDIKNIFSVRIQPSNQADTDFSVCLPGGRRVAFILRFKSGRLQMA